MKWRLRKRPLLKKHDVFLQKLSDLLEEGYTFSEALYVLLPHYTTDIVEAEHVVRQSFEEGKGIHEIFEQLGIAPQHLLLLELAAEHSEMERVFRVSANQIATRIALERQTQRKLMYPVALFIGLFVSLLLFRQYFLPNMTTLFMSRGEQQQLWSTTLFLKLPDILFVLAISAVLIGYGAKLYIQTQPVARQLQLLYYMPGIRQHLATMHTLNLAHIISGFLQSGVSLQRALTHIEQQTKSPHLSFIAYELKHLVLNGATLSQATRQTSFFRKDFSSYIAHGEFHGHIGIELQLYAKIIEQQQQERQKLYVSLIQPIVFSIVALCIIGAYLAILLPMYEMIEIM